MRADDRCAGRTPSHCAAARADTTLNLKREGSGGPGRGAPSINSAQIPPPAPRPPAPLAQPYDPRSQVPTILNFHSNPIAKIRCLQIQGHNSI
ncbi:hypothetical protein RR46_15020 [Papilio xuthus]|uniref:Uncharacterized protein n=1 Tax=Papilio xuthus TaxID=66420 RepID=A0A194PDV0_PAPXU|nr:hypothetical protein RR46_15020 [Papilio xuthus]